MSAGVLSALTLCFADPRTVDVLKCLRLGHLLISFCHVASATFFGAITKTLLILNWSYLSLSMPVNVISVLPKPVNPYQETDPRCQAQLFCQHNVFGMGVVLLLDTCGTTSFPRPTTIINLLSHHITSIH